MKGHITAAAYALFCLLASWINLRKGGKRDVRRRDTWFALRISTNEAHGPSGAGDRIPGRNLRNDSGVTLTTPRRFR